jgi:VanZ family protein
MLRRFLNSPRTWQIALAGYWLALFVGTHIPNNVPLLPSDGADKLAHFAAFALLATLLATTWQLAAGHLTARHLVVVWIVVVLYAAFDEWTQTPVGRDANIWDWTTDTLGALFALTLFAWLRRRIDR